MRDTPVLETERLVLRSFTVADAPEVKRLAGDKHIASTTLNIPHPYPEGAAEMWIASQMQRIDTGQTDTFAITLREDGTLLGAIGLDVQKQHRLAELGYWIGHPYWNCGYCTEAARAVIGYGFHALELNRIVARHFTRNPASGRVMQKIGMKQEGHFRQAALKWDRYEDTEFYALLRSEYVRGNQVADERSR